MLDIPCTAVIVPLGDHVTATARRYDPNQFGLPGGKVDPEDGPLEGHVNDPDYFSRNEATIRRGAARELREETGLVVSPSDLQFVWAGICRDELDGKSPTAMTWCFCVEHPTDQHPQAPAGEPEAKHVSAEELYRGPFASYNREALAAFHRHIGSVG